MPPRPARQPKGFMGILEDVVENSLQGAADGVRDFTRGVVEDFGRRQATRVIGRVPTGKYACTTCQAEGAITPTDLKCTACGNAFCARHSDYVHANPACEECLCTRCMAFLWDAGTNAVRAAAQQKQARPAAGAAPGPGPHAGPRAAPPPPKPAATDQDWATLSIARGSSLEVIQAAKKKLQKVWHPDKFPADKRAEAEERFKRVGEAADRCAATWRS